jgi:hypothetical protein
MGAESADVARKIGIAGTRMVDVCEWLNRCCECKGMKSERNYTLKCEFLRILLILPRWRNSSTTFSWHERETRFREKIKLTEFLHLSRA